MELPSIPLAKYIAESTQLLKEILSSLESLNEKLEESNKLAFAQKSELEEIRQEIINKA